jgi:hypothetical protein
VGLRDLAACDVRDLDQPDHTGAAFVALLGLLLPSGSFPLLDNHLRRLADTEESLRLLQPKKGAPIASYSMGTDASGLSGRSYCARHSAASHSKKWE